LGGKPESVGALELVDTRKDRQNPICPPLVRSCGNTNGKRGGDTTLAPRSKLHPRMEQRGKKKRGQWAGGHRLNASKMTVRKEKSGEEKRREGGVGDDRKPGRCQKKKVKKKKKGPKKGGRVPY